MAIREEDIWIGPFRVGIKAAYDGPEGENQAFVNAPDHNHIIGRITKQHNYFTSYYRGANQVDICVGRGFMTKWEAVHRIVSKAVKVSGQNKRGEPAQDIYQG